MIDRDHGLSLTRQADLLELSRGSLYYVPVGPSGADLELMREMDRLHIDFPFMGARSCAASFENEAIASAAGM